MDSEEVKRFERNVETSASRSAEIGQASIRSTVDTVTRQVFGEGCGGEEALQSMVEVYCLAKLLFLSLQKYGSDVSVLRWSSPEKRQATILAESDQFLQAVKEMVGEGFRQGMEVSSRERE